MAIWHDAKGDWDAAHNTAQNVEGATGAWVHAYLHRKEGTQATRPTGTTRRKPVARGTLDAEWERIVAELLKSR